MAVKIFRLMFINEGSASFGEISWGARLAGPVAEAVIGLLYPTGPLWVSRPTASEHEHWNISTFWDSMG